jgi:hypothetical protein
MARRTATPAQRGCINPTAYILRVVRNRAALVPFIYQDKHMAHNKTAKSPDHALPAGIMKELAEPRMSRSARIAEQDLDKTRNPEKPSTTMLGIVDKIIPSKRARQREKVQIAVVEGPAEYREICIENLLTDENGNCEAEKGRSS